MNVLRRLLERTTSAGRRRKEQREKWEVMWAREDFDAPWLGRGVSKEIEEAVAEGWFPAGGAVLDLGCGEGDVAAWLAAKGFPSVGVDIAPSAIARARARFPEAPGRLEFHALDVSAERPPRRGFRILIDRGCFHQLADEDVPGFVDVLLASSAPDARLLLFLKAFRGRQPMGDAAERARRTRRVEEGLGSAFRIVRSAETYLDPHRGSVPDRALPGLVFWMERLP